MGFGTIATQIILFVALVTVAGSFAVLMNIYLQETSQSVRVQKDRFVDELKTDITITSINYDSSPSPDQLLIYAENTGKTKQELNETDVYISGLRIERRNRLINVEADSDVGNSLIWDPGEIIKINITQDQSAGVHKVRVVSDNGIYDEDSFST